MRRIDIGSNGWHARTTHWPTRLGERYRDCQLQLKFRSLGTLVSVLFFACFSMPAPARAQTAEAEQRKTVNIDFARDIQPLLSKRCWECHGEAKQEAGLRLTNRQAILAGGESGRVVVPSNAQESRLVELVTSTDSDEMMPPEGDRLSSQEVALLKAWIDQGMPWTGAGPSGHSTESNHWAYQPLRDVAPPQIKNVDWAQNPIDNFISAELEQQGIAPSPQADRYTLIRRLSLDLLGLLPSVEEVDEFVRDARPNAYEILVDRLLDSQHFGERWGRHWLDLSRYADSDGYEKDNARPDAYRWRDWVIDAINADMPFDQFTVEQLAGDLLAGADAMQRLATAFHRQTLTNTEGGTDKEQFRVEACFDRTETTGTVWLGLTIGCARCHAHKYDAISQREYYQLYAVFNNGDEENTVVPKSKPEVDSYGPVKAAHDSDVAKLTNKLRGEQAAQEPAFTQWLSQVIAQQRRTISEPVKQHALENVAVAGDAGVEFAVQKDASILVSGKNPTHTSYVATAKVPVNAATSLRLDILPDDSLPKKGPGRSVQGNFVLSELNAEIASSEDFADSRPIEFQSAVADFEQADRPWRAQDAIDGKPKTGWAISPEMGKAHWLLLSLKQPLATDQPQFIRVRLDFQYGQSHSLGRFKLSLQTGYQPETILPEELAKILAQPAQDQSSSGSDPQTAAALTGEQRKSLFEHYSSSQLATKTLVADLVELRKKEPPKPELTVRVIAQRIQDARKTFVLRRGEFLEPLTESEVSPGGLATLPPLVARNSNAPADRLDLARWLVAPNNPLTPRVTVNHIWAILFGSGLVRTPNDFGVRGELPSHPELLDWLASDFIGKHSQGTPATPWSRKSLIKRIVMSATYRQESGHRADLQDSDPQNRLLARQNRLRVEGEIVRDISLDAAGLLAKQIGGPSVYPPLPPGIAELSYAGNFKWNTSAGPDRYRRGMYTFFKRTAPHPNLTTFDCPDANLTCVERQTSNTPLQALTVLNNESFVEAFRALGKRMLAQTGDDSYRLAMAFRICVARQPSQAEQRELHRLLADSLEWFRTHTEEAKKLVGSEKSGDVPIEALAAWTNTARVLMNLDEFLTRE